MVAYKKVELIKRAHKIWAATQEVLVLMETLERFTAVGMAVVNNQYVIN